MSPAGEMGPVAGIEQHCIVTGTGIRCLVHFDSSGPSTAGSDVVEGVCSPVVLVILAAVVEGASVMVDGTFAATVGAVVVVIECDSVVAGESAGSVWDSVAHEANTTAQTTTTSGRRLRRPVVGAMDLLRRNQCIFATPSSILGQSFGS